MSIDLETIHADILAGLPGDQERIRQSRINLDYYRGHFRDHRYRIPGDPQSRNNRSSLLMKRVVDCLTGYLYRDNPVRTIRDNKVATDFLDMVYQSNSLWAKMQSADRLSMVGAGGAVAFLIAGTDNEKDPIKLHLWADHSFAVFTDDDDPLSVQAVVTLDQQGKQDRLTLWTADRVAVYLRDTSQGVTNDINRVSLEENPYGTLPFSFAHFETPVLEFHSGSIGNVLREVNDYIIYRLTSLADALTYLAFPIQTIESVDASWKPPRNIQPGDFLPLPATVAGNGAVLVPKINSIAPPLGFAAEIWNDSGNYINHSLECAGVPESAIRMVQSVARSGESIAQEQAPLVNYARARQRSWLQYETELAKKVLEVAVAHLRNHGVRPDLLPQLEKALEDFSLSVRWSPYYSAIPGPERDRASAFEVANSYSSRIQVLQEREGLTHEEAVSRLERVAADAIIEARILSPMNPVTPQDPAKNTEPVSDSNASEDMDRKSAKTQLMDKQMEDQTESTPDPEKKTRTGSSSTQTLIAQIANLTKENEALRSESKKHRLGKRDAGEEAAALRQELEKTTKELDHFKKQVEASPDDLRLEVEALRGEARSTRHKEAFRQAARAAGVREEALDDVFSLSGYKTETEDVDPEALKQVVTETLSSRPYLKGEKPRLTPGPGVTRGATSKSGFAPSREQITDPAWLFYNQEKLADSVKNGTFVNPYE